MLAHPMKILKETLLFLKGAAMKHYILFTDDEFEDMMNGREIEVKVDDKLTVYCMSEEHFKQQNEGE